MESWVTKGQSQTQQQAGGQVSPSRTRWRAQDCILMASPPPRPLAKRLLARKHRAPFPYQRPSPSWACSCTQHGVDSLTHWALHCEDEPNKIAMRCSAWVREGLSFPQHQECLLASGWLFMTIEWQIVKEQKWVYEKRVGVFPSEDVREEPLLSGEEHSRWGSNFQLNIETNRTLTLQRKHFGEIRTIANIALETPF